MADRGLVLVEQSEDGDYNVILHGVDAEVIDLRWGNLYSPWESADPVAEAQAFIDRLLPHLRDDRREVRDVIECLREFIEERQEAA